MIHPLDPEDAPAIAAIRTATRQQKAVPWRIEARKFYDALLESVSPRDDVTFESAAVGGIPGVWVRPASSRSDEAILHVHGGWFVSGSATAYRHLVGHIAARAGAKAFVPDYRLAPEHPFPAAVDDVLATGGTAAAATRKQDGGGAASYLHERKIDLTTASAEQLVSELADPNLTWRMLAMNQIVDRLGKQCGQHFASMWEFVAWARKHRPDLDLTSPPVRTSKP